MRLFCRSSCVKRTFFTAFVLTLQT